MLLQPKDSYAATQCEFQILSSDTRTVCPSVQQAIDRASTAAPSTCNSSWAELSSVSNDACEGGMPECRRVPETPLMPAYDRGDLESEILLENAPDLRVVLRVFSVSMCRVQMVLEQTVSDMWCMVSDAMKEPLLALMTLYIAVLAGLFMFGLIPATNGQFITHVIKIALVWTFATNGDFAINIAYNFFITAATEGISIVLNIATPDGQPRVEIGNVLDKIDNIFSQIFVTENPFNISQQNLSIFGGVMAIASTLPIGVTVGLFFLMTVLYSAFVFVKAVIAYLLALVGIAFLTALGPLFVSFALFNTTASLFDRWTKSLISYVLQPILLFAFLIFIEQHIHDALDFFACFLQNRVIVGDSTVQCQGPLCMLFDTSAFRITTSPCTCDFIAQDDDWGSVVTLLNEFIAPIFAAILLLTLTNAFLDILPLFARNLTGGMIPRLGGTEKGGAYAARMVGIGGFDDVMAKFNATGGSKYVNQADENGVQRASINYEAMAQDLNSFVINDLISFGTTPERTQQIMTTTGRVGGGSGTGAN